MSEIRSSVRDLVLKQAFPFFLHRLIIPSVASKCGFDVFGSGAVTNSAAHIKQYIEGTIERLGFTPDLYYLHRIDPSTSTNPLIRSVQSNIIS